MIFKETNTVRGYLTKIFNVIIRGTFKNFVCKTTVDFFGGFEFKPEAVKGAFQTR